LKCLFFKYLVDMSPARPVASIKYVKVVVPVIEVGSLGAGDILFILNEALVVIGEAGGDGGEGGGMCVQSTEIGRSGSVSEKVTDFTLVSS
jgi:hypothetical protein